MFLPRRIEIVVISERHPLPFAAQAWNVPRRRRIVPFSRPVVDEIPSASLIQQRGQLHGVKSRQLVVPPTKSRIGATSQRIVLRNNPPIILEPSRMTQPCGLTHDTRLIASKSAPGRNDHSHLPLSLTRRWSERRKMRVLRKQETIAPDRYCRASAPAHGGPISSASMATCTSSATPCVLGGVGTP